MVSTEDPESLAERLESYRPWCRVFVRQSLFGAVGRRLDESDVIQSTWVEVLRKADQFRGSTEAEFFGWLRTCLQNNLRNAVREHTAAKRDVRREQDFAIEMDSATLHWFEPQAPGESPSDHAIEGERALALAKGLETLPDSQRQAIELRHLNGLPLSEVAATMEKTPDAVVSLMRRGIKTLNARLKAGNE